MRARDSRAFFIIFVKYPCQFLSYSMPCSVLYGRLTGAMCASVVNQKSVKVASGLIFLAAFNRVLRRFVLFFRRLVSPISVLWIQYGLLRVPLGPVSKGLLVLLSGFGLSWLTASLLRRVPGVARIV